MNRKQRRAQKAIAARSAPAAGTVQPLFAQALASHQAGKLDEAAALYRQILGRDPRHADSHHLLGLIAHQQGRHDSALEMIDHAIAIKSRAAPYHVNRGNSLRALGRLGEAAESHRRAIALEPKSDQAYYNLGTVLQELGRLDEAVAAFQKALALVPGNAEAHNNLGNALKDQGKLDEAIASYGRATVLKPDFALAHYNLGIALHDLQRFDEAASSFRRTTALKPDFAAAFNNLGNALRDMRRFDEAIEAYRRLIDLEPGLASAFNNLGNAFKDAMRLDEALAAYRRAVDLEPDSAIAYNGLGDLLIDLGAYDEAIRAYRQVLRLDPADRGLDAAVYLAVLFYLAGDLDSCRAMLRAADPIAAATEERHRPAFVYWQYVGRLASLPPRHAAAAGTPILQVIGESHALALHRAGVRYGGRDMVCTTHWIWGCMQWHLANGQPNRSKHRFAQITEGLPRGSTVLLTIGEIDCRPDAGIIGHWQKHPERPLDDIIAATVTGYVQHVAQMAGRFGHHVIVSGVPATNLDLAALGVERAARLVEVIRSFNRVLAAETLAAGLDFLDVHALTDRGDGIASGTWHLDHYHLSAEAMARAFEHHLRRAKS